MDLKAQRWEQRIHANTPSSWVEHACRLTLIQAVVIFVACMIILYIFKPPFIGSSSDDPLDIETPYLWKTAFWATFCTVIFVVLKQYFNG